MAEKTLKLKTLQLRNDTSAKWTEVNPVLAKGEIGIAIDLNKFKIGDGVKKWSELPFNQAEILVEQSETNGNVKVNGQEVQVYRLPIGGAEIGGVKTANGKGKVTIASDGTMSVSAVAVADKLTSPRVISLSGDATAVGNFDGSQNVNLAVTLKNSGVVAGEYSKVTVDSKGIVTKGANLVESDIPNISYTKVNGLGTAATKNVGSANGNIPVLGADGKLSADIIPSLAITETHVVATEQAMLELQAQIGDIAIRTDVQKTFILQKAPATVKENWVALATPSGDVISVNGKTGVVVLTSKDITENTNLYFTEARATQNFNTNIAKTRVASLQDGASVVMKEDVLTLDCGNA